jgi:tetratricopeptide (TPR) repeat protein
VTSGKLEGSAGRQNKRAMRMKPTVSAGLCCTVLVIAVLGGGPASGQQGPDEILDVSRRMVELQRAGKHAEALPLAQQALEMSEEGLNPDHPTVAIYLEHLAALYRILGEGVKAEPLLRRALSVREKALGPDHLAVSYTLHKLAGLYEAEGKYAEAEPLFQRALAIKEKRVGPTDPTVALTLEHLSILLRKTNRPEDAARLESRAKAIRENSPPATAPK